MRLLGQAISTTLSLLAFMVIVTEWPDAQQLGVVAAILALAALIMAIRALSDE